MVIPPGYFALVWFDLLVTRFPPWEAGFSRVISMIREEEMDIWLVFKGDAKTGLHIEPCISLEEVNAYYYNVADVPYEENTCEKIDPCISSEILKSIQPNEGQLFTVRISVKTPHLELIGRLRDCLHGWCEIEDPEDARAADYRALADATELLRSEVADLISDDVLNDWRKKAAQLEAGE